MRWVLTCLAAFAILGCSNRDSSNFGMALQYMPPIEQLRDGVVAKYYIILDEGIASHPKADIRYVKSTLSGNRLVMEHFDAGFDSMARWVFALEQDRWILQDQERFRWSTESIFQVVDSVFLDFREGEQKLSFVTAYPEYEIEQRTTDVTDSMAYTNGKGGAQVTFYGRRDWQRSSKDGQQIKHFSKESQYTAGLGQTFFQVSNEESKSEWRLQELMTEAEFQRRSNHGLHRVGYIDTTQVIDTESSSDFELCDSFERIFDYCNDDDAGFIGGKGSLWALIKEKVDPSLLSNESGYLTYRFVVNCDGKAGWFVTEEAGLDYRKKHFSPSCKKHLYSILKDVDEWKPLKLRGKPADAYTYITFKLEDGKIIELLP